MSSTPPEKVKSADQATLNGIQEVLDGSSKKSGLGKLWPFLGPAFVASVAYVDPGNFATNIQGGAQFGYTLLWVIVLSNAAGILIQTLSAKLGIATGKNLAELCRDRLPNVAVFFLWLLMEGVAMATDLAEFLGAAIGFQLLFGMPLGVAGLLTAVVSFLILGLERFGFRPLEAVITGFVGVIAGCYLLEVILGHPNWGEAAQSFLPPKLGGPGTLLLASGILGATVMPHVIFLHSALTQNRVTRRDPVRLKKLFRYEFLDILLAMGIAGLVNAAMLLMAAATFHQTEEGQAVASIEDAYKTLQPLLGPAAAYIFAISLLAAGLSSSSVGTMAGQIIMQGFLRWHLPVWLRRFITILPSLIVIYIGCDPTQTLIWSQVILSFGLPFAVFPLILFTRNKALMGTLVNRPTTTFFAWVIGGLVVLLNLFLLWQTFFGE